MTFFDLWPLNRGSGEKVTVETFACLFMVNMLAPLVLQFDVVLNLTSVLEWDYFDKFDLLTPLMTFDPDEKKYTGTPTKCNVPIEIKSFYYVY